MENWFKHDSTAHADAKILQLLMHDKAYYANYWLTLEWLFLLEDATASNKELDSLYYFLRETKEYTNEFIDFCLDIGLFVKEENCFYSTRLKEQKLKQAEKSAKAKDSIARRWNNRNTNVIRTYPENDTNVIQNRIEENRIEVSTNVDTQATKKNKYNEKDFQTAKKLFALLISRNPAFAQKYKNIVEGEKTCQKWAADISLMIRIDNREYEQISFVLDWINSQAGEFWQSNILSGKKLREKYDVIVGQMQRKPIKTGRETAIINY